MDICDLKNAELEPQFQNYIGRHRGDDDSGAHAVFAEQGSSASQMTAAKVMDVIARPPGCAGQAADAVSAYAQVKEDASQIVEKLKIRRSRRLDTSSTTNGPSHAPVWKIQWFLLNESHTHTHLLDYCGRDSSRKFCWNLGREQVPNWECLLVHRKQGLFLSFLSVDVVDIRMAGKNQNVVSHVGAIGEQSWS